MPYGPSDSIQRADLVDPAAQIIFAQPTKGVWVGVTGNLAVTMINGQTAVFVGVQAGTLLPIQITQVLNAAAGTTATNILACF